MTPTLSQIKGKALRVQRMRYEALSTLKWWGGVRPDPGARRTVEEQIASLRRYAEAIEELSATVNERIDCLRREAGVRR